MHYTTSAKALLLSLSLPLTFAYSGYYASCIGSTAKLSTHYYTINCYQDDPSLPARATTTDLNLCLGNSNGALVVEDSGGYYPSCDPPYYTLVNSNLDLHCKNNAGTLVTTSIDLNTFMSNLNGHTVCLGHYGT